jgi:hypothetical protein
VVHTDRLKHAIQNSKRIMTIAWNPLGFELVETLPKGRISNAWYCRDNILAALIPLLPEAAGRWPVIHADNARPILLKNVELSVSKTGCSLLHTRFSR